MIEAKINSLGDVLPISLKFLHSKNNNIIQLIIKTKSLDKKDIEYANVFDIKEFLNIAEAIKENYNI